MIKRIILLTSYFPFGNGETFLEAELPFLSRATENIEIIPVNNLSRIPLVNQRSVPLNVKIRLDLNQKYNRKIKSRISRIIATLFDLYYWTNFRNEWPIILDASRSKQSRFINFKTSLSTWSCSRILKKIICKAYEYKMDGSIFYSYWHYDMALALGFLRHDNESCRCVSRVHGADLYSERRTHNYLPFTQFKLESLDRTIAISENGRQYLRTHYPRHGEKICLSRLGVFSHTISPWSPPNDELRILTCSSLTTVKRIPLLIQALKLCDFPIKWTHIGSGPQFANIQIQSSDLPSNIRSEFLGQISNSGVREYYSKHQFDLFINVSEHEGLPVSIMEAQSSGIPVMATDVGGNFEIVNSLNGIELPANPTPVQIATELKNYLCLSHVEQKKKRENSLKTWRESSNADIQFPKFINILETLFYD
jgi:glycosyltransferase involved in cell wall biosynthesis